MSVGARTRIPEVVVTLDDDVVITPTTIKNLVRELLADPRLGAVCSQARVLNKNTNLLTRLQGLEYVGYNATRLADEGFYQGPLVMHGMLTAFRTTALKKAGGFAAHHLIEDYEMTARLKQHGWHVRSAVTARAWTTVPETFRQLWLQRTRWLYGGLTILAKVRYWPAVIQDVIGHTLFLATLSVVAFSFLGDRGIIPPLLPTLIIVISLVQLVCWYLFNIWLMWFYPERDRTDWLIRLSLIPEFIYANLLTIVVLGAYLFLIFGALKALIPPHARATKALAKIIENLFRSVGYTHSWGTRGAHLP